MAEPNGVEVPEDTSSSDVWAAAAREVDLPAGLLIAGRYRLQAPLGRGGMGEVWRGFDEDLRRPVAIKVLRRLRDSVLVARFQQEGRLQAAVEHDHVLRIFDKGVGSHGQILFAYLVMELLSGPTLAEVLASRGPLPVERAAGLAIQVASALEAAHQVGVIHRDVKPGNLMFDARGRLKVLDFGVARLQMDDRNLTGTGIAIGTPAYLSPEQAVGGVASEASDVYSLGCVLFEMFVGTPPFSGGDWRATLAQHAAVAAPRVADRTTVPETVDDLVARMLAKRPDGRPSLGQVQTVLSGVAGGTRVSDLGSRGPSAPVEARHASPPAGRKRRRRLIVRSRESAMGDALATFELTVKFAEDVGNLDSERADWLRSHLERVRGARRRKDPDAASVSLAYIHLAVEALVGADAGAGDALSNLGLSCERLRKAFAAESE